MKKYVRNSTDLAPVSAVLVSCGDLENSDIVTIAWAGTVNSDPPMVSISVRRSRYSYELIRKSGEFVVNLVDTSLLNVLDGCGVVSGRDVDKFQKFRLTKQPCEQVTAPAIQECPVSLECAVRHVLELKTHVMFVAEIVGVTAKEEWIEAGKLTIPDKALIAYVQNRYVSTGETLGTYGYTAKAKKD